MKNTLPRIAAVVALVMIIGSMLLSTVAPGLGTNNNAVQPIPTVSMDTPEPTALTFPTPDPAGPNVVAAETYVHPSGTFMVMRPQGWLPAPTTTETIASVSLVNNTLLSVVHAYIQAYTYPQDVTALDAENSADQLASSWSAYDAWRETNRIVGEDRLTIDFELDLTGNTYLARHITWGSTIDPNLAVVLRIVVPNNNPALLDALTEAIIPSYQLIPEALSVPLNWQGYVDQTLGYEIRLAPGWQLVDGGPGSTATFATEGETLTLNVEMNTALDGEDAARAWVEASHADAEVVAVAPLERAGQSGFSVAYRFPDADGASQSGLALLLPTETGGLLSANLRINASGVNLLAEDADPSYSLVTQMLGSLAPLPAEAVLPSTLSLPTTTPEITPTPAE